MAELNSTSSANASSSPHDDCPNHKISARTKVRDGQVANRPVYAAIGVTVDGRKDVLGLWMGVGGEGAKFWMSVLIDLKNRGVRDVFFLVCDGLKGLWGSNCRST